MDFSPDQFCPRRVRGLQPRAQCVPVAAPGDGLLATGQYPFTQAGNQILTEFHERGSSAIMSTARKARVYRMVTNFGANGAIRSGLLQARREACKARRHG